MQIIILTREYLTIIINNYKMENRKESMKKFVLILIGLSIVLGGVIFIIYRNDRDADEEVVEIFKEEVNIKEEKIEDLPKNEKENNSTIMVDIKGMVHNPGVYEVESTKRVNDVINMAGGLTEDADTSNINLAKIVKDEMTIIIYSKEEVLEKYKSEVCVCDCPYITNDSCIDNVIENSEEDSSGLININTADKEKLMSLPSLGEAKAKSIIEYRKKNGNFASIEKIMEVSGIGEAIFEKIKDYITV